MKLFLAIFFSSMVIFSHSVHAETKEKNVEKPHNNKKYELVSGTDFISLGKNGDWESFFLKQENETICWISSTPEIVTNQKGDKVTPKKSKSVFITSIRPDHNVRNEISFHSNKKLNEDKRHIISVDKKTKFYLSAQGRWAWLKSSLEENRFVLSAQNGNNLFIRSFLNNGDSYDERYSLKGYTKAYQVALEHCAEYFEAKK